MSLFVTGLNGKLKLGNGSRRTFILPRFNIHTFKPTEGRGVIKTHEKHGGASTDQGVPDVYLREMKEHLQQAGITPESCKRKSEFMQKNHRGSS